MSERKSSPGNDYSERKAQGWYAIWRKRILKWVKIHTDSEVADYVTLLPDMLMLCVGLIRDQRVPSPLKVSLVSAVLYVLSPFDLVPEALLGVVGLVDDAGVLALALHGLLSIGTIEMDDWESIFHDHWHGDGNPVHVILKLILRISKDAGRLVGKARCAFQQGRNKNGRDSKSYETRAITITS